MLSKEQTEKLLGAWSGDLYAFVYDNLYRFLIAEVPGFHKEIYRLCDGGSNLALAAPRGFAKSKIISIFYPIREALFARRKSIHIISASEGLAISWLREIKREIESNRGLLAVFGDVRSDKWTEDLIILKNGVEIRARGAGGQSRGQRPDLIVLDDIETDESVASEDQRNKMRDWVNKSCIPSLTVDGRIVWIGTFISPLCLLREKIDNPPAGWATRIYSAYVDGVEREGNELWPQLWSHQKLQQRKSEIGSFAFASEYLNNPMFNDKSPIQKHHIRYWEELPKDLNIVIALDPAYSEDENSDYKVAVAIGADSKDNRYLIEYIRTHAPVGEYIDLSINMYLRYKGIVTAFGVPNTGTEKMFFESVAKRINERRVPVLLTEVKNFFTTATGNVRNKQARIVAALQPLFEQGRYFINKNHSEAESELLSIGCSRNDDLTDAMTYAESLITPVYNERQTQEVDNYGIPSEKQEVYNYGYA